VSSPVICLRNNSHFHGRLGPLDLEHKKRANVKRSKLEKNKEEERRPQELKEEDIARSENETTKNVVAVRPQLRNETAPLTHINSSLREFLRAKTAESTYSASSSTPMTSPNR
jgi:hypothetical protein